MVLVQGGTPSLPHMGDFADATVLTIPAATIAVNNDGILAFMQALNRTDAALALCGSSIYEDALRRRVEGYDFGLVGNSWHSEPKLEMFLIRRPDIALLTVDARYNVSALGRAHNLGLPAALTL